MDSVRAACYEKARNQLCSVNSIAESVLYCVKEADEKVAAAQIGSFCSRTARVAFEMLTDRHLEDVEDLQDIHEVEIGYTEYPSVTYVNLTGIEDFLSDDDGHRFIVIQCKGLVRILQANNTKPKFTVKEFVESPKYARCAAPMTFAEFSDKWAAMKLSLKSRGRTPTLEEIEEKYKQGEDIRDDGSSSAMTALLGFTHSSLCDKSRFLQAPIKF